MWFFFMQDELNGKRKVEVDLLCDRCGMEPESTIHVLKGCPWASGIWLLCPLALHTQQMQALNFSLQPLVELCQCDRL